MEETLGKSSIIEFSSSKVANISPKDIIPSPLNCFQMADIEQLAGSILYAGLIEPLSVIGPDDDGKYYIMSGERRYRAIQKIRETDDTKFNTIPCYICGNIDMSQEEQSVIIRLANVETRDITNKKRYRFEIVKILYDMAAQGKIQFHEITREAQKQFKCSGTYARLYTNVFATNNKDLIQLVADEVIPLRITDKICNLSRGEQDTLVKSIKDGTDPKLAIKEVLHIEDRSPVSKNVKKREEPGHVSKEPENNVVKPGIIDLADEDLDLIDDDVLMDAFLAVEPEVDISLDSSGELGKLRKEDAIRRSDSTAKMVIEWCRMMQCIIDYTDAEERAIESIRELVGI